MSEAKSPQFGECERVVVTTADGRVFDLGKPDSKLFRVRLAAYQLRRRKERGGDE